ncbi:MAG: type II toxin-antitoxin system VapB family antitoxin [Pseudomonadota bacterium]
MGISIKNEEVESKIRELALRTGETVTEAVKRAVETRLGLMATAAEQAEAARQKEIDRIIKEMHSLPIYDDRRMDDLLYNEDGLPK